MYYEKQRPAMSRPLVILAVVVVVLVAALLLLASSARERPTGTIEKAVPIDNLQG